MDFLFLKATRFWVMVIGCLTIIIEGNFTFDSLMKAISAFAIGFITVRTIDRASETVAKE